MTESPRTSKTNQTSEIELTRLPHIYSDRAIISLISRSPPESMQCQVARRPFGARRLAFMPQQCVPSGTTLQA
jgi:hypothetical protein